MKTEQLNSEAQSHNEKTQKIIDQLYPHLLDRLISEGWLPAAQRGRASKSTPERKFSMFLPELDYYIAYNIRMGRFRECGYKNTGEITIPAHPTHADKQKIASGQSPKMLGFTVKGVAIGEGSARPKQRFDVLIPSSTLKIDVSDAFLCRFDSDYRVVPQARTHYMPGVADKKQMAMNTALLNQLIAEGMSSEEAIVQADREYPPSANNNRSARTIMWRHPEAETKEYWTNIFMPMVQATREYWDNYVPDDGGNRLVTKATMMTLLDKFERGEEKPGEIDWHIVTYDRARGETVEKPLSELSYEELKAYDRPQKISLGPW